MRLVSLCSKIVDWMEGQNCCFWHNLVDSWQNLGTNLMESSAVCGRAGLAGSD